VPQSDRDVPDHFDVLIQNARIIDGTGSGVCSGDVGIIGERIQAIGNLLQAQADHCIDAGGQVLAPGFIDAHTHDDRAVLSSPLMHNKVSQGVTSVVAGNCGISLAPLVNTDPIPPLNLLGGAQWYRFDSVAAYMDEVERTRPALNIALLCGHSTLRAGCMDRLDRPAAGGEIEAMGRRLDQALADGCIGMSTGLAYPPAINAPTEEIIALAHRSAAVGGIYATHMRYENTRVLESVQETLQIGREANVPVVISHHKCAGRESWGMSRESLKLIAEARKTQQVNLDVYPYIASSTVLMADWAPSAEKVLVTWSVPHPEQAGRDLADIKREWGVDTGTAVERLTPAGAIYFTMHEDDLQRVLKFPDAMIGSDGLPHDEWPHPRLWGTFPRVLGRYSRELGLLSLEQAVHKMSGVPARVFGFKDRGEIREGYFADMVLFDPIKVIDSASFASPKQLAAGINQVFVNGTCVWHNGHTSGDRPGRVLRRGG